MKNQLITILLLLPCLGYGGDWDLFPLNQKSYYGLQLQSGERQVEIYIMDSILPGVNQEIQYFRYNEVINGAGSCTRQIQNGIYNNYGFTYMDSLVRRLDTVFFYKPNGIEPFFIIPEASVGQSWTVINDSGSTHEITITCSNIESETFFGITDSVKYFTLQANWSHSGQTPLDSFSIRLSKKHGLLEFVPFYQFLWHPSYTEFLRIELIGIDSSGVLNGYTAPKFEDYFQLNAGDVLMWRRDVIPDWLLNPSWTEYYRDSIILVENNADSVVYTFDRQKKDSSGISAFSNQKERFYKESFSPLVEGITKWHGVSDNQFGAALWFPDDQAVWETNTLILEDDTLSNDTLTSYFFYGEAWSIDTSSCVFSSITDIAYTFEVNTKVGIKYHCFNNWGTDCTNLTGWKISGVQVGSIDFPTVGIEEINHDQLLTMFPNPASETISLSVDDKPEVSFFEIIDTRGRRVESGKLQDREINIEALEQGVYILTVTRGSEVLRGRFAKL